MTVSGPASLEAIRIGLESRSIRPLVVGLRRLTVALLAVLALWLIGRRLQGAVARPLSTAWMCAVAGVLLLLATTLVRRTRPAPSVSRSDDGTAYAAAVVLILLAAVISLPGSSAAGLIAVWTAALVGVARAFSKGHLWRRLRVAMVPQGTHRPQAIGGVQDVETLPVGVVQQITRGRADNGRPYFSGRARVSIEPRQKHAHLHVAICPPLEQMLDLSVETIDGPAAVVDVGLLVPQGVRFDIRLQPPLDHATEIVVEFYGE